jgi:hypothetical protein
MIARRTEHIEVAKQAPSFLVAMIWQVGGWDSVQDG